ncbi:MAG: hypothetical protein LC659_10095 [Myxococcales bacterium]|nr:hypothetical protein [Myxococcales bacterium]
MRLAWMAMVTMTLATALGACGRDGPQSPADLAPTTPQISFDTASYIVQPGEEKRYYCFTTRIPSDHDVFVTEITPTYGRATHHLGVYYTLSDEPDGVFDCPELVKQTWIPLYGGGIESGTLAAPPGAAFHLKAGQQILVQLHLLNATPSTVTDKATITLKTTIDTTATPAGMFGMSNTQITLPAQAQGDVTMSCQVGEDMSVFAVFGHMHQLGTRIELSRANGSLLFGESWSFDDQPTIPQTFQLAKGDQLTLHCQYQNSTDATVSYGESTNQEMCAFVLYYTPYQHLDGCQQ